LWNNVKQGIKIRRDMELQEGITPEQGKGKKGKNKKLRRKGRLWNPAASLKKAALKYGSMRSAGLVWPSKGPSASHHWSGVAYFL
jgi:hypothetical protein